MDVVLNSSIKPSFGMSFKVKKRALIRIYKYGNKDSFEKDLQKMCSLSLNYNTRIIPSPNSKTGICFDATPLNKRGFNNWFSRKYYKFRQLFGSYPYVLSKNDAKKTYESNLEIAISRLKEQSEIICPARCIEKNVSEVKKQISKLRD